MDYPYCWIKSSVEFSTGSTMSVLMSEVIFAVSQLTKRSGFFELLFTTEASLDEIV